MTFTPPFILALSNGLWTANPPHRGVAALSLRPRSQHTLITIGPTKGVESGAPALRGPLNSGEEGKNTLLGVGSLEQHALRQTCYLTHSFVDI